MGGWEWVRRDTEENGSVQLLLSSFVHTQPPGTTHTPYIAPFTRVHEAKSDIFRPKIAIDYENLHRLNFQTLIHPFRPRRTLLGSNTGLRLNFQTGLVCFRRRGDTTCKKSFENSNAEYIVFGPGTRSYGQTGS